MTSNSSFTIAEMPWTSVSRAAVSSSAPAPNDAPAATLCRTGCCSGGGLSVMSGSSLFWRCVRSDHDANAVRTDGEAPCAVIKPAAACSGAQCALQVRLHRVQLRTPVCPVVRAVGGEVEHRVVTAGRDVSVLEGDVAAVDQILQELGRDVGAPQIRRGAVAAVDPEPG